MESIIFKLYYRLTFAIQRSDIYFNRPTRDVERTMCLNTVFQSSLLSPLEEVSMLENARSEAMREARDESSAVRTEKLGRCAEDGGRCVMRVRRLRRLVLAYFAFVKNMKEVR